MRTYGSTGCWSVRRQPTADSRPAPAVAGELDSRAGLRAGLRWPCVRHLGQKCRPKSRKTHGAIHLLNVVGHPTRGLAHQTSGPSRATTQRCRHRRHTSDFKGVKALACVAVGKPRARQSGGNSRPPISGFGLLGCSTENRRHVPSLSIISAERAGGGRMSEFTVGGRTGALTSRRLVPTGARRRRSERRPLLRMAFDTGFWHRVGTASGRCRSDPGLCHSGAVDLT